jgi:uncharacterized membrane protein
MNQKSIRDRLRQQASERMGLAENTHLSRLPVAAHLYNITVQNVAVERIVQLEETLKQIIFDVAEGLEPGNDREGFAHALEQILRRARAVNGNTTTRQPDEG